MQLRLRRPRSKDVVHHLRQSPLEHPGDNRRLVRSTLTSRTTQRERTYSSRQRNLNLRKVILWIPPEDHSRSLNEHFATRQRGRQLPSPHFAKQHFIRAAQLR